VFLGSLLNFGAVAPLGLGGLFELELLEKNVAAAAAPAASCVLCDGLNPGELLILYILTIIYRLPRVLLRLVLLRLVDRPPRGRFAVFSTNVTN
jgi:hypothetical protein